MPLDPEKLPWVGALVDPLSDSWITVARNALQRWFTALLPFAIMTAGLWSGAVQRLVAPPNAKREAFAIGQEGDLGQNVETFLVFFLNILLY